LRLAETQLKVHVPDGLWSVQQQIDDLKNGAARPVL